MCVEGEGKQWDNLCMRHANPSDLPVIQAQKAGHALNTVSNYWKLPKLTLLTMWTKYTSILRLNS